MIPNKAIEQLLYGNNAKLEKIFSAKKEKGMPFLDIDGNTYHMQARDKDRTNILGLYTSAKDFLVAGQTIAFTPYEDVKEVSIERDAFLAICRQFFGFFSALHFARKEVQKDIAAGNPPIDMVAAFDVYFHAELAKLAGA